MTNVCVRSGSSRYRLFLAHRFASNLTHHLTDATVQAAAADLCHGAHNLAACLSLLRSQMCALSTQRCPRRSADKIKPVAQRAPHSPRLA
jgi:hypothetical protein